MAGPIWAPDAWLKCRFCGCTAGQSLSATAAFDVTYETHEPARQGRYPPLHLSARLPVGLRARHRGDRRPLDRPGSRLQAADLYRRRRLRQGRALRRAHSSSRPAAPSDAPHRAEGLRPVRADFLGRGAGRNRRALRSGRARIRRSVGLALLLRRHHGARDARRHQSPRACEEIFAFLLAPSAPTSRASGLPSAPARSPASIRARWASPISS